jgi:hypothetical protein
VYRENVQISVMQGGSKSHGFDDTKVTAGSVGDMFERLKQSGHLTDKDIKGRSIVLRIDLWAVAQDSEKVRSVYSVMNVD